MGPVAEESGCELVPVADSEHESARASEESDSVLARVLGSAHGLEPVLDQESESVLAEEPETG